MAWADDRHMIDYGNIYVQHVDTSGNLKWPVNGIAVSPLNFGYDRVEPRINLDPDLSALNQDTFVVSWNENRDFPFWPEGAVYAQNITLDGKLGPLGIPEIPIEGSRVHLYPNPTGDVSWLRFRDAFSGLVELHVYNPTGQYLYTLRQTLDSRDDVINISASALHSGIYCIKARFDNEEQLVKWVVLK